MQEKGFVGAAKQPRVKKGVSNLVAVTLDSSGRLMGFALSNRTFQMRRVGLTEEQREAREEAREQARRGQHERTRKSPTEGKPYVQLVMAQRSILPRSIVNVAGRNFPTKTTLQVQIDGHDTAKVTVSESGDFVVSMPAPQEFGMHSITFLEGPMARVIDGTMFTVTHEDKR
jgi:hypothetical protein